ncbi:flavodoxin-dependent (E)-4-hydroxy-3-methylbut-2-enyl-diphosphate synthase [Helicovermis profundi]|uniref:4-hydroxy-3-methylbut-2-en-1-yl diphosphate synthase (flavodoxin) n=1 Tax=Helicovermis profundi TaxID=3065157 RepID=A0AAU9EMK2_9FIRM|nr:flavodoxin-dependent (E)-4-hydroxy-3-methylbut-2-enyl-diphosphate synthase [Clostridia bacterium S502]
MINRRVSKKIVIGDTYIGGDSRITIQSMTTTDTRDIKKTVIQIKELENAGCEIIRVAVPNIEAANALSEIKKQINIPLVADIHFDYNLALLSIKNGVDKLRINPGNIGDESRVRKVVDYAKEKNIPIRIGVNSGSIEKEILEKYNGVNAKGIVESALKHVKILEKQNFDNIVIALKSSDIITTIESYKLMAKEVNYPFHIGITESGTLHSGTVKSSIGIGSLLLSGLGDTLRVSLTGNPIKEVELGREILRDVGIRNEGINLISCPTCGRCNIDLEKIALQVEEKIKHLNKNITLAIMGCAVNGPGEASNADIGIAGGINEALIFKKGKILKKVKEEELIEELVKEIEKI